MLSISAVPFQKQFGVEDLYDATAWIVGHADMLNIDTTKIVISGGSAGATNSVMAEYYLCNGDELAQRLPKGFRYAGVIPFAGGIWKAGLSEPEILCISCLCNVLSVLFMATKIS